MKAGLSNRLDDPDAVMWVDLELDANLQTAFRIFQSITGFWRERATFNTTANTVFYDLYATPSLVPAVAPVLTELDVLYPVQYALWEPRSSTWAGASAHLVEDDVTAALTRSRNRLLDDTGCRVAYHSPFVVPAGDGRVDLSAEVSDSVIDVVRAQWISQRGAYSSVRKQTPTEVRSFQRLTTAAPIPFGYDVVTGSPLMLQLLPAPTDNGRLELVTVDAGADFDGSGQALYVPDNLSWGVVFGALADIYGHGGAVHSPGQRRIAQWMYEFAVTAAKQLPVVLSVEINGETEHPNPIAGYDNERPGWQGKTAGVPVVPLIAGPNLLAISPTPDTSTYSVTVDVAATAPSYGDTDFVQVGRELLEALLDCGEFVSRFKLGGYEAGEALEQRFKRFLTVAGGYTDKVVEFPGADEQQRQSREESRERPRRSAARERKRRSALTE